MGGVNSRMEETEERISGFIDKIIEITHLNNRENRLKMGEEKKPDRALGT